MSRQEFFDRTDLGIVRIGNVLVHVEAVARSADGVQQRGIEGIDGARAVNLDKPTGLDAAAAIAQQDERPFVTAGVLAICVVTGVDDERIVHHRAVTFRHRLQGLHDLDEHSTVVLPDLHPDWVVRLLHVPKTVPGRYDSESFPRTEDLPAPRTDRENVRQTRFQGRDADIE